MPKRLYGGLKRLLRGSTEPRRGSAKASLPIPTHASSLSKVTLPCLFLKYQCYVSSGAFLFQVRNGFQQTLDSSLPPFKPSMLAMLLLLVASKNEVTEHMHLEPMPNSTSHKELACTVRPNSVQAYTCAATTSA